MTPQSIRRAAKVLRSKASFANGRTHHDKSPHSCPTCEYNEAFVASVRRDHDEMLDLARQLEQLAKQTASATE